MHSSSIRRIVAGAGIAGLAMAGAAAQAAPQAPGTTPTLQATVANGQLTVAGDTSFPAGRLDVSLTATDKESEVDVLTLHPGYTFKNLRDDVQAFGKSFNNQGKPSKSGLRHLRHAIKNVTSYGGIDAAKGKTVNATLLIPKSKGHTIIYNDSSEVPKQKTALTVTKASGPQTLPKPDAHVVGKTNKRFGGDSTLPAQGVVKFTDVSTESPHLMFLQHVKKGTTRKQVIESFQSNKKPDWVLKGFTGTDFVMTNHSQNLELNLPAGSYAMMCFFPDPKTGQFHAAMGMVRMVQLK
jgi:hypothetical protein